MKIRSLFYHIKDGLKNIYRNRLFSLASIATIAACIFLFGLFYSLVTNFQYMIHKAENEVCVTVFFDQDLTDADIKKLGDTISQRNEVSRYTILQQMRRGRIIRLNISRIIHSLQKASRMIILLLIHHLMRYISMMLQVRLLLLHTLKILTV